MFVPVSGEKINIQDIKLSGDFTEWNDSLQILDEGGASIAVYQYFTKETSGMNADGWQDGDTGKLAEHTLLPGQSILIDTDSSVSITYSGVVNTTDTVITSGAGFNFIGNNSPVPISIQDIKLSGDFTEWNDSLQILDEGGASIAVYQYFTKETSGMNADGWQDGDTGKLAEHTLLPGQGVLIDTASPCTITIPGVNLK